MFLAEVWVRKPGSGDGGAKAKQTHLPTFPFDLSGFGNRISSLVDVKLFGENFVLEVRVLVEGLQEHRGERRLQRTRSEQTQTEPVGRLTKSILYPDLMSSNSVTSTLDR